VCNLDGNNTNQNIHIIDNGLVKMVWYPLLDAHGLPLQIRPGIDIKLSFQFNDKEGIPSNNLLVVNATVCEASAEHQQRWLPKTGAAFFQTKGVALYSPHGQVRIIASTDYVKTLPGGVMFTLGFSK
jgi:hypothetical protein